MDSTKRICRILEVILRNKKDVRFKDVDRLLKAFGYEVRQPRRGGSHYVYRKAEMSPITVPYNRPSINEFYVKKIIGILGLEEFYDEKCKKRR